MPNRRSHELKNKNEKFTQMFEERKAKRNMQFAKERFENPLEKWVKYIYTEGQACKLMDMTPPTLNKKLRNPEKLTIKDIHKLALMLMLDPHLIFTAAVGFDSEHYNEYNITKVTKEFKKVWEVKKRSYALKRGNWHDKYKD